VKLEKAIGEELSQANESDMIVATCIAQSKAHKKQHLYMLPNAPVAASKFAGRQRQDLSAFVATSTIEGPRQRAMRAPRLWCHMCLNKPHRHFEVFGIC
jgi:hypothetical protein